MVIIKKSTICVCLLIGLLSEINFLRILVRSFVKSNLVPRICPLCRFIQKQLQLKFELRKKIIKKKTPRNVATAKNYLSKTWQFTDTFLTLTTTPFYSTMSLLAVGRHLMIFKSTLGWVEAIVLARLYLWNMETSRGLNGWGKYCSVTLGLGHNLWESKISLSGCNARLDWGKYDVLLLYFSVFPCGFAVFRSPLRPPPAL